MSELLWIGVQLTIFGMGLVFLLLIALWWLTAGFLRFDKPAPQEPAETPTAPRVRPSEELDPELVAAITIAVSNYREVRLKQAAPLMRTHRPGELPSRWVGTGRTRQNRIWFSKKD